MPTNRRGVLAAGAAGLGGLAGLAGCLGTLGFETRSSRAPPLADYRPDAVYRPTHVEGMAVVGTAADAGYRCALTYTYPHRFWLVTGTRRKRVEVASDDSVHLMAVVWDAGTGVVPPDINPQITVTRDGESVTQVSPWPMLSQPMGFHFGDNVALSGEGTYRAEVSVGAPSIRRTGSLADNEGRAAFAFGVEFSGSRLNGIAYRDIPEEEEGTEGAVEPMAMEGMPDTRAPAEADLPGTVRGSATGGDLRFVATTLPAGSLDGLDVDGTGGDAGVNGGGADTGGTYLAVSPRTRYNRYVVPLMSLSATLRRGGETVHDGVLRAGLDPDLNYHYGAVVPGVEAGDDLTVAVDAPPQVARHEGYETAFFDAGPVTLAL